MESLISTVPCANPEYLVKDAKTGSIAACSTCGVLSVHGEHGWEVLTHEEVEYNPPVVFSEADCKLVMEQHAIYERKHQLSRMLVNHGHINDMDFY